MVQAKTNYCWTSIVPFASTVLELSPSRCEISNELFRLCSILVFKSDWAGDFLPFRNTLKSEEQNVQIHPHQQNDNVELTLFLQMLTASLVHQLSYVCSLRAQKPSLRFRGWVSFAPEGCRATLPHIGGLWSTVFALLWGELGFLMNELWNEFWGSLGDRGDCLVFPVLTASVCCTSKQN